MSKANKMKVNQVYINRWQEWRDAGNEPKSRAIAVRIVQHELSVVGINIESSRIRETLAHDHTSDEGSVISSPLSFMVWDLTTNDGKALDYGKDTNYFAGLLSQARLFITSYTRVKVKTQSVGDITVPQYVSVRGAGLQPIRSISRETLSEIADREIESAHLAIRRWKALGATRSFVQSKLTKLANTVLADYDVEEEAA